MYNQLQQILCSLILGCFIFSIFFDIIYKLFTNIKNYHEYEDVTSGDPVFGVGNLRHNHY